MLSNLLVLVTLVLLGRFNRTIRTQSRRVSQIICVLIKHVVDGQLKKKPGDRLYHSKHELLVKDGKEEG